jgi:2',3'-cyclic-nucleotide 2'-phosphodiesterase (5'-nucleotidase family)
VDLVWDRERRAVADFRYRLVPTGRKAPKDPDVHAAVDAWEAKVAPQMAVVIGRTPVALSEERLRPLIERIYKDALGADFGFQNRGGIRAPVAAGDVTVGGVITVLPFPNTMVKIRLRGEQVPEHYRKQLGAAWDPEKEYVVATNSFVGDQRRKYFRGDDLPVEDTGLLMYDVVIDWVRRHGGFQPGGEPLPAADERDDPR